MMNNLLNGMFGKVGNGMCRLSISVQDVIALMNL